MRRRGACGHGALVPPRSADPQMRRLRATSRPRAVIYRRPSLVLLFCRGAVLHGAECLVPGYRAPARSVPTSLHVAVGDDDRVVVLSCRRGGVCGVLGPRTRRACRSSIALFIAIFAIVLLWLLRRLYLPASSPRASNVPSLIAELETTRAQLAEVRRQAGAMAERQRLPARSMTPWHRGSRAF